VIAVELGAVVADEPIIPERHAAHVRCEPKRLAVGEWGIERIVYLPGIALVVVTYQDTSVVVIPVEHIWHMSVRVGVDALDLLAQVMA
jgi:hypothetical protein